MMKTGKKINPRGAGILLHISSLPSAFAIGDMGPEAFRFADFLAEAGQTFWQILPLNPVSAEGYYSPYSSASAFAGNTLLISPEALSAAAWWEGGMPEKVSSPSGKTDFPLATRIREEFFAKAYSAFLAKAERIEKEDFEAFKQQEAFWLDDYALFEIIKNTFDRPWFEWEKPFRNREQTALKAFSDKEKTAIDRVKWLQFIFHLQWRKLKEYCNGLNIKIVGDLPFYLAHDSADVWSHPHLFALDADGKATHVAGVPPDYFNSEGQLWGMPLFDWEANQAENYHWWLKRIEKNLSFFDVVRLDHFRAFSTYWSVAAPAKNAVDGEWKPGPGREFLNLVQEHFPHMPFVAEDLGDVDEAVYDLRDEFSLPGMKVIQFGFGDDLPRSLHIPHNYTENYFAYTGTHDNDTTRGWFLNELDPTAQMRLSAYCRKPVHKENVHRELAAQIYASVAKTAIIPIQDLLGLGAAARMNAPASVKGNWSWRLTEPDQYSSYSEKLHRQMELYNRLPFFGE